ncbi:MAG: hypothetical protein K8S18_08365 [Desulfobacula sp.]|nr:hypothetical protein [Desulfobacula sp.]
MRLKNLALLLGIWLSAIGLIGCNLTNHSLSKTYPNTSTRVAGVKKVLVVPLSFPDLNFNWNFQLIRRKYGEALPDYIKEVSYGKVQISIELTPIINMPMPITEYRLSSWRIRSWEIDDHKRMMFLVNDAANLLEKNYDISSYDGLMMVVGADWKALGRTGYLARTSKRFYKIVTPGGKRVPPTDVHVQDCPLPSIVYALPKMLGGYKNERILVPTMYNYDAQSRTGSYGYANFFVGKTRGHDYSAIHVGPWDIQSQHGIETFQDYIREFIPQGMTSFTKLRLGWISHHQTINLVGAETRKINLGPLWKGTDETLVVRLPVNEELYYLIENRQKKGVDKHLPSEGILILEVNEKIPEGQGPVRVVNAHPDIPHFKNAPFKTGEKYENQKHGLSVKVFEKQGDNYLLEISREF